MECQQEISMDDDKLPFIMEYIRQQSELVIPFRRQKLKKNNASDDNDDYKKNLTLSSQKSGWSSMDGFQFEKNYNNVKKLKSSSTRTIKASPNKNSKSIVQRMKKKVLCNYHHPNHRLDHQLSPRPSLVNKKDHPSKCKDPQQINPQLSEGSFQNFNCHQGNSNHDHLIDEFNLENESNEVNVLKKKKKRKSYKKVLDLDFSDCSENVKKYKGENDEPLIEVNVLQSTKGQKKNQKPKSRAKSHCHEQDEVSNSRGRTEMKKNKTFVIQKDKSRLASKVLQSYKAPNVSSKSRLTVFNANNGKSSLSESKNQGIFTILKNWKPKLWGWRPSESKNKQIPRSLLNVSSSFSHDIDDHINEESKHVRNIVKTQKQKLVSSDDIDPKLHYHQKRFEFESKPLAVGGTKPAINTAEKMVQVDSRSKAKDSTAKNRVINPFESEATEQQIISSQRLFCTQTEMNRQEEQEKNNNIYKGDISTKLDDDNDLESSFSQLLKTVSQELSQLERQVARSDDAVIEDIKINVSKVISSRSNTFDYGYYSHMKAHDQFKSEPNYLEMQINDHMFEQNKNSKDTVHETFDDQDDMKQSSIVEDNYEENIDQAHSCHENVELMEIDPDEPEWIQRRRRLTNYLNASKRNSNNPLSTEPSHSKRSIHVPFEYKRHRLH